MVYHHISVDMKCRALRLLAEGWELGKIADSVSEKSVNCWLDNYVIHGQVDPGSMNHG